MKLVFFRRARDDLDEILAYIAQENPEAAERTVLRIQKKTNLLLQFPDLGGPGLLPQTREFSVPGMPYLIPYRIKGSEIQILRIYHHARQPYPFTFSLTL